MHLVGGGFLSDQKIDGRYDPLEANAVRALQTAKGLPVTGVIDRATWKKLLAYTPYRLTFTSNSSAVRSRYGVVAVPESASLPALGYEIPARGRG
jgi:peptidoglycan hydrolase-like protein with peptidoglycan-binding domain